MSDLNLNDYRPAPGASAAEVASRLAAAGAARTACLTRAEELAAARVAGILDMDDAEMVASEQAEARERRNAERLGAMVEALRGEHADAERRDAAAEANLAVAAANDAGAAFADDWRRDYATAAATIKALLDQEADLRERQKRARDAVQRARELGVEDRALPVIEYPHVILFGCTSRQMQRAVQLPGADGRLGEGAAWNPDRPPVRVWPPAMAERQPEADRPAPAERETPTWSPWPATAQAVGRRGG